MDGGAEDDDDDYSDSGDDRGSRRRYVPKKSPQKKATPPTPKKSTLEEGYESVFQSFTSAIQNINSIVNSKPSGSKTGKKKFKIADGQLVTPRPKMIHTQKTRVPVDTTHNADGKLRHKTKTLVTRTLDSQASAAAAAAAVAAKNERVRPRTKNVNYHVLAPEKYPLATFDEDDTEAAVNNLLAVTEATEMMEQHNGFTNVKIEANVPDVAGEEVICGGGGVVEEQVVFGSIEDPQDEVLIPAPPPPHFIPATTISYLPSVSTASPPKPQPAQPTRVTTRQRQPPKRLVAVETNNSLKPGKHVIGPANKIVRYVKSGMVVSKKQTRKGSGGAGGAARGASGRAAAAATRRERKEHQLHLQQEAAIAAIEMVVVKQEVLESSSLHELAELSMQHAKNQFKCEMCSEVFSDRTQLLLHVPIHI